jgi:bifunctional non-homologous end joining protein LigD
MPSRSHGTVDHCAISDVAGLVWLANLACIEIHPFLARAPRTDHPTQVVFDLDPGEGCTILDAGRVALTLHDALDDLGFETLVKSTGSKGLHVTLPLDGAASYDVTKPFARTIARALEQHWSDLVVSTIAKDRRRGHVLVDWGQNDRFKSNVAPYSLRGKLERPTVAAPLTWPEVDDAVRTHDESLLLFGPDEALDRIRQMGELHSSALRSAQTLSLGDGGAGAGD